MNWRKKGPELKLSELHVPDFVYDLYYDLKERHLLPLVAVLLVAIVAVPIFVKGKSSGEEAEVATPPAAGSETGASTLTVARSQSGLRDPSRRLKHARALDPFAVRGSSATAAESAAAESAGEGGPAAPEASVPTAPAPTEATVTGSESSYSPPSEPTAPVETYVPPTSSSGGETEASGGESGGKTRTRYASEAIDVRIVTVPTSSSDDRSAKRAKPKAQVRRDLPELTMLPTRATPAVTFMGTSRDGKKALLLVSSDVESVFGEAKCIVGSQSCQLLALEPQMPETIVYGPHERTYRIELLKITRTVGAKPRRAALGATKGKAKHGAADESGSEAEAGAGKAASGAPAERGGE